MALDQWVINGTEPPPSRVPRQTDHTAVMAVPRPDFPDRYRSEGSPGLADDPGRDHTGVIATRYQLDFGPSREQGIVSQYPPRLSGRPAYAHFVSKVDPDGNEVAGIRLPPVEAPIATATGRALRRAEFGGDEGCEASGQHIAFRTTKTERLAAGDPRLSLEER